MDALASQVSAVLAREVALGELWIEAFARRDRPAMFRITLELAQLEGERRRLARRLERR